MTSSTTPRVRATECIQERTCGEANETDLTAGCKTLNGTLQVPWVELGELETVIPKKSTTRCATCVFRDTYPDTTYEWAMKIPQVSTVQPAFMNGWGRGEAVTLYPM